MCSTMRRSLARFRLNREVAFGIESDRAIVQICRAHAQQYIVDDHHLGVHHDVNAVVARGDVRAEQGCTFRHARRLDNLHETDSSGPHDVRLEP